jgi:tetratricopeptide (TPR) repeat protein
LCGVLVLGACAAAGMADELTVKKLPPYPTPTITGYSNGKITFRTQTGEVSKPLADVDLVKIAGQDAFNKAEDLFDKKDFAGAAKAFESVPDAGGRPWVAAITKARRLQALGEAGMIDKAAQEWVTQLVAAKGALPVVALMPRKFGAKGSAQNATAIALLEKQIAASKDAAVVSELKQLLAGVYEAQGDSAKVATVKEVPAEATSVPGQEPAQEPAGPTITVGPAQLRDCARLVENNNGAEVIGRITPAALRGFSSPSDLATGLLILGKAQLQVAKGIKGVDAKAKADRKEKLQEAGVSFMRVAVFCNSPDQAAEAMFDAGEVCTLIGDKDAAMKAYDAVMQNYRESESPKALEFVKKAQDILEKAR